MTLKQAQGLKKRKEWQQKYQKWMKIINIVMVWQNQYHMVANKTTKAPSLCEFNIILSCLSLEDKIEH